MTLVNSAQHWTFKFTEIIRVHGKFTTMDFWEEEKFKYLLSKREKMD